MRLLEEECIEISNRNRVKEACEKLTIKQEQLMEIFEALIGEYSSRTDRQSRTKTIEEIEKMEHDFSEVINRAQQYLDNTFRDVFSHAKSSRVKPASTIQPGEGYKQSDSIDTRQSEELEFSKEEIEIQTVLAETELSRQTKALEEQVQQKWVRLKEQENATRLRLQQPVNLEVKCNTMSKSVKQEVERSSSSDGAKYQRQKVHLNQS